MSTANTRYSMRLRTRGNTASAADNDATTAASASTTAETASRTALGNISNREGNNNNEGNDQEQSKPKRATVKTSSTTTTTTTTATRRGRSAQVQAVAARRSRRSAAARGAAVEDRKPAATTNTTKATEAAAKGRETTASRKAAFKKMIAATEARAASRKRAAGAKRSSTDANAAKPPGAVRASKRVKKSLDSTVAGDVATEAAVSRRSARSRPSATSRGRVVAKRAADAAVRGVAEVKIVRPPEGGDGRVVPPDFGLQRDSFDGRNFTYGIAHYDESERSDPLRCKDYVTDMFQHLYRAETDARPRPYMDRQEDINAKMRAILVDWLVEVHMKFRLVPETLYLCVHIIDRYCSVTDVARSKLQLVGVTALFLACKHEEIYPPEVRDCVYITDRAYDRQEVLDMEQTLLRVLDWKISLPTAYPFLDRFLGLTEASEMTRHTATYYLERTLQEHDLLQFRPSVVCASAVILALNNPSIHVREGVYARPPPGPGLPKILMEYTEFDKDELVSCMTIVATKINEPAICASRRHLTAVSKKYEHRKYNAVSSTVGPPSVSFVLYNMD